MLNLDVEKWIKHDARFHGREKRFSREAKRDHPQIICGRTLAINRKGLLFRFSIGKTIAEIIDIKKGDVMSAYMHKINKNLILLFKGDNSRVDYKISDPGGAFFTMDVTLKNIDVNNFKQNETTALNHDITADKMLLVDLSKIMWRN